MPLKNLDYADSEHQNGLEHKNENAAIPHVKPVGRMPLKSFDYADSEHKNVATAMDFLGPTISVVNTYVQKADTLNIPNGWYVRNCKCINKACWSRFLISSPGNQLSSAPAKVRIMFPAVHTSHSPTNWSQWYEYRLTNDAEGSGWDCNKYPRRPGLPFFLQLAVEELLCVNPHAQPAQASAAVASRFQEHHYFSTPGKRRKLIIRQLQSSIRHLKRIHQKKSIPNPVGRVDFKIDLWGFIDHHRVKYEKLTEMKWKPQVVRGHEWQKQLATHLRNCGVISGLGSIENSPETHLVVLDSEEVLNDAHWNFLKMKSKTPLDGTRDVRRTTVVFTSIALLGNAIWCDERKWEVCASVDGSHAISNTSYILMTLGILGFSGSTCSRTFHPLVYTWGESESEIVATTGSLTLKWHWKDCLESRSLVSRVEWSRMQVGL
jgi:hypothetical protein